MPDHTLDPRQYVPALAEPEVESQTDALWADFGAVRNAMLWDLLDSGHTARGLVRFVCAVGWVALAVMVGSSGWGWAVPMVVVSALTVVHGQRPWCLALIDRAGAASGILRALLPYPQSPGFHWLGMLDLPACICIGIGSGWISNSFATPETMAVAPAISILAIGALIPGALNMTSHVSWELDKVRRTEPWRRPALCVASAVFVGFFLWPRNTGEVDRGVLLGIATSGAAMAALIGAYGQWKLRHEASLLDTRTKTLRLAVQDADSHHVHQLKNLVRPLYEAHEEIMPEEAGQRARDLAIAIAAIEQMLKAGSRIESRGLTEILSGLVGMDDKFEALRQVTADLDPATLTPGDAELLMIAAGDLASNALKAKATTFSAGLTATPLKVGSLITLTATCDCGTVLRSDRLPDQSSLMRLARKVRSVRGSFLLAEDGTGRHTFTLTWQTTARPTSRPSIVGN